MVFCKDCRHYHGEDGTRSSHDGSQLNLCAQKRNTNPAIISYHPVNGKTEIPLPLENCMVKNKKCNCKDYEDKRLSKSYSSWKNIIGEGQRIKS